MEIFRALGALIEPPDARGSEDVLRIARLLDLAEAPGDLPAADVYTDLFLFQLYPYASVYLSAEGMLGGEARDRIAGFLRTLGAEPPKEPDHLAFLLACHADLAGSGDADEASADDPRLLRARKALLWEHLLSWLPAWLHGLRRLEPPAFYAGWAELLDETLRLEAGRVGPPDQLPLHLREAPALGDPNADGAAAFVQGLLTPARSGMVLVRDDLRRAADDLGLGLRAGERRYAVEHLLGQDADAFVGWLANEARAWSAFWADEDWLGPVAGWWRDRSATTARILDESTSGVERATSEGTPTRP